MAKRKQPEDKNGVEIIVDERGMLDVPFLVLTILLTLVGVIMVFSASYARSYSEEGNSAYYFVRQAIFAAVGIAAMLLASRVPYHWWERLAFPIYLGALVLLVIVLIPGIGTGRVQTGAQRWINLGFTTFQPSELAKLAIILLFATKISRTGERMLTFRDGVLPYGLYLVPIIGLLVLEPHLSAIIIICGIAAIMMYLGGTKLRWFGIAALVAVLFVVVYLKLKPYANARILAWRDPEAYADDDGYQILQSLYAIGSGGLMGLGLGRGRQKYLYLPEEHNDYIFAEICEELGFVGAAVIILLFVLLIVRGYWLALHAKDRFGSLLISGITTMLALQVFLNIGVVTNFLPATGISLPFFSYGGTALLMQLGEMGIVLAVSRQNTNKLI